MPRPILLALALALPAAAWGADPKPVPPAGCAAADDSFEAEVWAKVGAAACLQCHKAGGDAEASQFVLLDPRKSQGAARAEAVRHNREAFVAMAKRGEKGGPRLLLKATGGLNHGGHEVLKPDSAGYRVLAEFAKRVNGTGPTAPPPAAADAKPFFDGVAMVDDRVLLRRLTLSLAGRLPTAAEAAAVAAGGLKAVAGVLDAVMKEAAFDARIREAFNDIFLTHGVEGNPDQNVLSYEHFQKSRQWYAKFDLSHIADEKERRQAHYKLTDDYRAALRDEPMHLVSHIVRNDRPFTEIVTADYVMVSPYTARGYGIFDEVKDKFQNVNDPFEFVPARLPALKAGGKDGTQDSPTGFYPHAGLLGTFQYLVRYSTTETNRNRLRGRMYYQHFLGVDVLELAARGSDAAAATAKYKVPTMQASECVVCHKSLDPVAGLFQEFWRFEEKGVYGKRKGGWFADMFGPGFEGEDLPAAERWRALPWLGERTAKDPRFAVAMVEHAYYVLAGRRPLLPPKDLDDPLHAARARAWRAQRCLIEGVAARFAAGGFNFKLALRELALSDFYRAAAAASSDPARRAELDDVGLVRMLAPEQLERKVAAIFGERWGKLNGELAILYGGINSKSVTERAADPSGAMGAIQRMLSNDVAARHVVRDFAKPAAERRLFPGVELAAVPGSSPEADATIRRAIVRLHGHVLGRADPPDSPEVDRTFKLFAGVVADAKGQKVEKAEIYAARTGVKDAPADPDYTLRAWRAVVTYLLRRPEFLYE